MDNRVVRVGISGTGYIAQGLISLLRAAHAQFVVTTVLTRQPLATVPGFVAPATLTRDPAHLVASCDMVVECSGTVGGAARVVQAAISANLPVVTLNAEFQLTLGSHFAASGLLREARGDQPGSLAALDAEARAMGFEPLVYASQKGFLNPTPTPEDMRYWADRQGISVPSTVSFTDGTKVHIEQALVANGLGASIAENGLLGPTAANMVEGGNLLAQKALDLGVPLSDFILLPGGRGEVFVVARHDAPPEQLRYYKLGDGPFYLLERPFHLGHFEVPLTMNEVLAGTAPQLTAGVDPAISVAAFAKRPLEKGLEISKAVGSFDFYGRAVRMSDTPDHVPIGLIEVCRLKSSLAPGQMVCWGDVALTDEVAFDIAQRLYPRALS